MADFWDHESGINMTSPLLGFDTWLQFITVASGHFREALAR